METEELDHLLTWVQDGVVARRQLFELGATKPEIRRMLRRRGLVTVHPGVYVNHTGPLTWEQRAWSAVLVHWPASLARESALPHPPRHAPIQVAIDHRRTVRQVAGVIAHRTADLKVRTVPLSSPPRIRLEHAAIDVANAKDDVLAKFRVFADAVQSRETSAAGIAQVLRTRRGVRDRLVLLELLDDLAGGACSVLEREYLRLERRHGLPTGGDVARQALARVEGRKAYRDVLYAEYGVIVELDGRAFHDDAIARDRDALRDLVAMVEADALTVRLTYGLVFGDGCRTIAKVAALLRRRGWPGEVVRCSGCADS